MKKILIIEDDKRIAAALQIRLKSAGYEVATASDGLKGIAAAVETRPDLIISDIWLPGAVGFLVAERLKNLGCYGTPVIFITASKKRDLWKLAQEAGAVAFFEKPYNPEKLLKAITDALTPPAPRQSESVSAIAAWSAKPATNRRTREKNTDR